MRKSKGKQSPAKKRLPLISHLPSEQQLSFSARAPEIEGYEILDELGESGQGQVWRAIQLSTQRHVALKVPKIGLLGYEKVLARFEREVELAARLKHPNIARIHDSGVRKGLYYYAMDLIEGRHLDQYVEQHNLTRVQILELMRTICQAVQHAHQSGVIHRDLKPSNIIVTEDGQPCIVDFGLAKSFVDDNLGITISIDGEAAGTPAYMSPEQAAGHMDQLDTRTDVYSLGAILFTLLTGDYPHDMSGSRLEVMHRIAEEEVRQPRTVNHTISRDLEALLLKALDKNPDRRYSSAGGLAEDIDNYLTGAPLIAGPLGTVYRLKRFVQRHRALVTGVAAVVAVLMAGIVVALIFAIGQARARADAQAVTNFLTEELLASTNPFTGDVPEVTLLSVLDAASDRLEGKFDNKPLVEAPIRHALGQAYWRRSKYKEAEAHLERARRIYQQELGAQDPKTLESMLFLGLVYRRQGRNEQAQSLYYRVVQGMRRVSGEKYEFTFWALNELAQLGIEQYRGGAYEEALATLTSIEKLRNMLDKEAHASEIAFLAMAYHQLSRDQEAQTTFNRLLRLLKGHGSATSDFIFAAPTNLGSTINSSATESCPSISADGLSLYFASNRSGGCGGHDIWVTSRATRDDEWGGPVNLGPTINSPSNDWIPTISADGLSLFFCSLRPGGYGRFDAWMVRRATIDDGWSEPVNLGPNINSPENDAVIGISADGLLLFVGSQRADGYGSGDIWLTTRATKDEPWPQLINLGPPVNSWAYELCTNVWADSLILFFGSGYFFPARPGGSGGGDLWVSTRETKDKPWREPVNLGPTINSWADELGPSISFDGSALYFFSSRPGGFGNFDLWQASTMPIVDVTGDGKVDVEDLCKLAAEQPPETQR